jgi:hypothetical protein
MWSPVVVNEVGAKMCDYITLVPYFIGNFIFDGLTNGYSHGTAAHRLGFVCTELTSQVSASASSDAFHYPLVVAPLISCQV